MTAIKLWLTDIIATFGSIVIIAAVLIVFMFFQAWNELKREEKEDKK